MSAPFPRTLRCTLVWLSTTAALLTGASLLAQDLVLTIDQIRDRNVAEQSFETLLVCLCSLVAAACCVWLWLTSTVVIVVAALGSESESRLPRLRGCPGFVRRAVLFACGVAVVSSLAEPANAEPQAVDQRVHSVPQTLAGLPLPERAIREPPILMPAPVVPVAPVAPVAQKGIPAPVRVQAGDSLWSIAADTLGDKASTHAINARWQVLYEINRAVIGSDPDLILPGQMIRLNDASKDTR